MLAPVRQDQLNRMARLIDVSSDRHRAILHPHKPSLILRRDGIARADDRSDQCIPIRGPSGQFALFSLSDNRSDDKWKGFTENHIRDLLLVSHYINQKALELERGTDQVPMTSLSPRETDALTMLALGMSRAQAAENLSISEHTLRVYIESARFKLAAMNTTHAVARAMAYGLLVV